MKIVIIGYIAISIVFIFIAALVFLCNSSRKNKSREKNKKYKEGDINNET